MSMQNKNPLYDLALRVSEAGPDDLAFDGLRVLQHPERFRKFLMGKGLDIEPVTLQIWPSLSCNVRCPTCPFRLTDAKAQADNDENLHLMPLPLFRKILKSIKRGEIKSVLLTGGGEPLMNPDIGIMAEELHSSGLDWGGFTNGLALTTDIAERLLRAKPGMFRVSLDAGDPSLYKKMYAAESDIFELVKSNIIAAGKIASKLGYKWFGIGFALIPNVTDTELVNIRNTFIDLLEKSNFGMNFASFRPRVVHHNNGKVVIPQKWSGQYHNLAIRVRELIVLPIESKYREAVRLDHKFGAFADCDRDVSPTGGWGHVWNPTLDHRGLGSIISHLAGSSNNPSRWDGVAEGKDFWESWKSDKRKKVLRQILEGEIKLPVANGARAVDAFLEEVRSIFPEWLDEAGADKVMDGIESWDFHRSSRPNFVG